MTENQIIHGCLHQDPKAQKELVRLYSGYLFTVARRYMPDEESAKDILQDGLIKIFTYFHQFRNNDGKLKNWMSRIVANEALRKRQKYLNHSRVSEPEAVIIKVQPEILGKLHEEDLLEIIRDLPDVYRTVFNLYVLEGYSHNEIGTMLDINPSTSRSNLTRAKAILRNRITELEIETQWEKINSSFS